MKKRKINAFYIMGVLLIAVAVGLYVTNSAAVSDAEEKISLMTERIEAHLPTHTSGSKYYEGDMPAYSLDGTDYIGLMEVQNVGIKRPILAAWSQNDQVVCPSKYYGSVYENTLVIGGSSHKGQMDFLTQLDIGYKVTITDMLGNEYSYEIQRIDRANTVNDEQLISDEYPLTLFTYQRSEKKFIVVRCGN